MMVREGIKKDEVVSKQEKEEEDSVSSKCKYEWDEDELKEEKDGYASCLVLSWLGLFWSQGEGINKMSLKSGFSLLSLFYLMSTPFHHHLHLSFEVN